MRHALNQDPVGCIVAQPCCLFRLPNGLDNVLAAGQTILMPAGSTGKTLASVTLPGQVTAGKMHVFGLVVAP